jgi:2-polyprenyl-3-methyl-5-hydroxy-6-metoxy-1,4-benzoquinol methylase
VPRQRLPRLGCRCNLRESTYRSQHSSAVIRYRGTRPPPNALRVETAPEEGRRLDADQLHRQYDRWHEDRDVPEDDSYQAPWHLMARDHLTDLQGLHVLEIGCGRGSFARYLQQQGANLVAADFSESAIEITKRRLAGLSNCQCLVADVQEIPFEAETFDVVISLATLEHVRDPNAGIAELVRVTRIGGRLIVMIPNYFSLVGLWRIYCRLIGRPYHEVGQPINHPLFLIWLIRKLKKLGCSIDVIDGRAHLLGIPMYGTIELRWLERPYMITKWFAFHTLAVGTKVKALHSS